MKRFHFKAFGLYTTIYHSTIRTFMQEIIVSRNLYDQPCYKVVRKFKGTEVSSPPKGYSIVIPPERDLHEWLIFEGHELPLVVNSMAIFDQFHPFRFVTTTPDELRSFIAQNCLNPSVQAFAGISYTYMENSPCRAMPLFPPCRTLHGYDLYEETEAFPGVYHAINHRGEAVLHDGVRSHGHAYRFYVGADNFAVRIHHNKFYPGNIFSKNGYKSQESANKALLFHANRLFNPTVG